MGKKDRDRRKPTGMGGSLSLKVPADTHAGQPGPWNTLLQNRLALNNPRLEPLAITFAVNGRYAARHLVEATGHRKRQRWCTRWLERSELWHMAIKL